MQAFALVQDQQPQQRKTTAELHVLIPRSTQRAIIDHYLEAVAQEYPMLSPEQESALTTHENPLRWSSSANEKDNPCAAGAMNVVLAVSGAMIARDLAVPHLSSIARRCGQDVYRHSQKPVLPTDSMATVRWTCTAACAVVLCDLVSPAPDHLWESLGRAIFIIEQLRECYRIQNVDLDTAFRRQEFTILKLERYASPPTLMTRLKLFRARN